MYLVTGAAGFIGSHIVRGLNDRGVTDILAVDDLSMGSKFGNLSDCTVADYMDRSELVTAVESGTLDTRFQAILHQGACTDTMEYDGRYMMENNFTFSKRLFHYALMRKIPFIYASSAAVYGAGRDCKESPENEHPLNVYGYSKLAFDQHVRGWLSDAQSTVVGLRYFNVYGPRETQKGKMASMVYQLHRQLTENGTARLFEGTDGYADGEQRRDFVYVDDIVGVNLFFADGSPRKGIFNVGSGRSRSFNDIANTLIKLLGRGSIEYIPFPEGLRGKYQSYTQADISLLRQAGYDRPFSSLEDGIAGSFKVWQKSSAGKAG
jgi:ADP-L-glycero-D-manno-heptose 6-epimerase